MFLKHLLIHYDVIMMKILIFLNCKMFFIENVDELTVVFTILNKKNEFLKLIKN